MTRQKYMRVKRTLAAVFAVTAALYALMGILLIGAAYAQQTRSTIFVTPNKPIVAVPTGSDDKAVKAFFDYDNLRHVSSLEETYFINPYEWETMYLVIGAILIMFYTLAFAWFSRSRRQGDLYPVEVYNGYMAERGGPVDIYVYAGWTIALSYMVYYTVINLMYGQYY